jgi:hypothetical protein
MLTSRSVQRAALVLAAAGATACAASSSPAAETPRAPACFGGPFTTIATGEQGAGNATLVGDSLYWFGSDVRRMVLKTRAISSLGRSGGTDLKVVDARVAVGSNNINQLEAIDLATGKSRVIVDGQPFMDEPILFSALALDAKYLYFGRDSIHPPWTRPAAGFYRVPREGGAPEKLADSPDGETDFIVSDGYVYWTRVHPDTQLVRRRLQKDTPVEVLAATKHGTRIPLAINAGRIYYPDAGAIFSVPIAGGAPPTRHAAYGEQQGVLDVLADGACVYWVTSAGAILRAQAQGGVAERIGSLAPPREADRISSHELATDGSYLYWADSKSGSILRVGRSAAATAAPIRTVVARLTTGQPAREMGASKLIVGSGWGCVRLVRRGRSQLQCWRAPDAGKAAAAPIRAQPVPWLDVDEYAGSADRLCALVGQEARCWRAADLFGPAPRDAPPATATQHTIYDPELAAGSGFACTAKAKVWTCSGDDSYGQLGKGTAAAPGDRLFGLHAALGAAHGCVMDELSVRCWGRNDTMQLGFSSTDTCRVGQKDVPCSRAAKPPAFPLPDHVGITAADTYTCAQRGDHHCWGASRDGLFGTAEECPPGLRGAFPTRSGTVTAPNATCSAKPAELTAFPAKEEPRTYRLAIGPRGACGIVGRTVRCAGAIPTPPGLEMDGLAVSTTLAVSPGDDASACAAVKGGVSCWGAAYSPAGDPTRMFRIDYTEVPVGGAAVDGEPPEKGWPQHCDVEFACEQRALPACPAGLPALAAPWSVARGGASDGTAATLAGPLMVQAPSGPDPPPEQYRCPSAEALPIVIGDAKSPLVLDGLTCTGDTSRRCCMVPALGQNVVVKGRLAASGTRWILRNPELCAPR